MKKNLLLFLCLLLISYYSIAQQQEPFLQWQKIYGGTGNDVANSIQQTKDGGYIVAGYTNSISVDVSGNHGKSDYWIVKTDALGNIQWSKCYGGRYFDEAYSIQQTKDGGYIVAGESSSNDGNVTGNHGNSDYWIVKLNARGNIQWQKCYGGSSIDVAYNIIQTTDGGYVVTGFSESNNGDVTGNSSGEANWIIKIDGNGNLQWQKTYGFSYYRQTSIQQTTDGGYIVAGSTYTDINSYDYWVLKLDSAGNIQWQKTYGGSDQDNAYSIRQTTDGGYIVAGSTDSHDGDVTGNYGTDAAWIVKIDGNGNIQWKKTYGDSGNWAYSIKQTTDGGYIAAGLTHPQEGNATFDRGGSDYWIAKINSTGDMQWQKTMGGSNDDQANAILQTTDEGFIVAGNTQSNDYNITHSHGRSDEWIVKLSPETLDDNININLNHATTNCSSSNSLFCLIKNNSAQYVVKLYRFGILYDSAFNITKRANFSNLPSGAYYATATDAYGAVTCSRQIDIVPSPGNLEANNVTSSSETLTWNNVNCASDYTIQFKVQGSNKWKEKQSTNNGTSYSLNNLTPSTTYVCRIASLKRVNGIKATGKFSDSIMFTTASSLISTNQANNISSAALNSNKLSISPNPAKNSFKIFFSSTLNNKINAMLYNVNGKAVWSSGLMNKNSLNNKTVITTSFAKGIYYLKLTDEDGKFISSTKVVVAN